jgi:hypothetical protein
VPAAGASPERPGPASSLSVQGANRTRRRAASSCRAAAYTLRQAADETAAADTLLWLGFDGASRHSPTLPEVWVCPQCGARLTSRDLWHSCGQFRLEALFAGAAPGVLELAREYVTMLRSLGDVRVIAQKTRLVCVARVRFAGLSPRKRGFQATFALHRWLDSSRIVKKVDYGPRWCEHYVMVQTRADLDDELRGWLQEAHHVVGLHADLPKRTGRRPSTTNPGD